MKKTKVVGKVKRSYPRSSLEEALKIAQVIKEKNGGKPWPPSEVAKAVGFTSASTNFFYQTSAAQAFGLTRGTRDAKMIELSPLGQEIVYAPDAASEIKSKRKAFFGVQLFKEVFEHYNGSKLPETKYLSNTLENNFHLDPKVHEEFIKVFKKNCDYLKLDDDIELKKLGEVQTVGEGALESEATVLFSEAKGEVFGEAFVIMPFSERQQVHPKGFFNEVLNSLVVPAAVNAGFKVRTAKQSGSDLIQSTIINALSDADLVIADLTEHNPNVLFELGVRMALGKPVLLIKAEGTDRIFDVDNMLRVFDYNANMWPSTVKSDIPKLSEHIQSAWERRTGKTYMQILRGT